jgi:hypothetical protein
MNVFGLYETHQRIISTGSESAHSKRKFVLILPDQYIAWRGNVLPAKPEALLPRVRASATARCILDQRRAAE